MSDKSKMDATTELQDDELDQVQGGGTLSYSSIQTTTTSTTSLQRTTIRQPGIRKPGLRDLPNFRK